MDLTTEERAELERLYEAEALTKVERVRLDELQDRAAEQELRQREERQEADRQARQQLLDAAEAARHLLLKRCGISQTMFVAGDEDIGTIPMFFSEILKCIDALERRIHASDHSPASKKA